MPCTTRPSWPSRSGWTILTSERRADQEHWVANDRFSTPISQKDRARLVDAVATWNFKPHNLSDIDLFRVACLLFEGLLHSEGLAELQLELGTPPGLACPPVVLIVRPHQQAPFRLAGDIPCTKPIPQLYPRHRRASSDLLLPHRRRRRPSLFFHPRPPSGHTVMETHSRRVVSFTRTWIPTSAAGLPTSRRLCNFARSNGS